MKGKLFVALVGLAMVCFAGGCNNKAKQSGLKVGIIVGPELAKQTDIIERASRIACSDFGQGQVIITTVKSYDEKEYKRAADKLFNENESNASIMGLVIGGNRKVDLRPMIRSAVITGHPVILFSCDEPDSKRDAFVGADEIVAGKMLGKAVAASAGTSTKVVVLITGDEKYLVQRQRASAIRGQLKLNANISIIKTIVNKDSKQSAKALENFLKQMPNVYAVISTGAWMFTPEYQKVLASYKGKIFAIANTPEAIKNLKLGKVQALVVEDLYGQVYDATDLCLKRLQNQVVENPKPLTPMLVTSDNIDEFQKVWGKRKMKREK